MLISKIAVENIKKTTDKLKVDLYTIVADWDEMKSLQRAFLKASVPDADVPTDYAIYSVLYETARREKIKYILNGHSFRTEGTSPDPPISTPNKLPTKIKTINKGRIYFHTLFFSLRIDITKKIYPM